MRKVAFLVILLLLGSCTPRPEEGNVENERDNRQSEQDREYYILPIETVDVTGGAAGPVIAVHGPLGDGCQRFAYMDSVRNDGTLNLTFWASRPKAKNVACTMIMQYVDRQIVVRAGEYTEVAVHAPDNGVMRKPL